MRNHTCKKGVEGTIEVLDFHCFPTNLMKNPLKASTKMCLLLFYSTLLLIVAAYSLTHRLSVLKNEDNTKIDAKYSESNVKKMRIIISTTVLSTGLLIMGLALLFYVWKKQHQKGGKLGCGQKEDLELPLFDLMTVVSATSNFSSENKLGEGGFGSVFKFPVSDGALLRSGLDSARLYFHQKASYPAADMVNNNDPCDWCKTSGCNADPPLWLETYDYRPGLTPLEPDNTMEFPPAALPDIFSLLAKAARDILDAISFYLNLRSSPFTEVLDNVPLRNRPSFQGTQHHSFTTQEDGQLVMFSDHEHQVDKSLISLVKSDKAGLHIKDFQGRWFLVDEDLGPQEAIVYPGLALYQATAGYVNPALQRTETANTQSNLFG
ncbi:hypothetical protein PS1_036175 [Malus domestica]